MRRGAGTQGERARRLALLRLRSKRVLAGDNDGTGERRGLKHEVAASEPVIFGHESSYLMDLSSLPAHASSHLIKAGPLTGAAATTGFAPDPSPRNRRHYELRNYELRSDVSSTGLRNFYRDALFRRMNVRVREPSASSPRKLGSRRNRSWR